jgi:5-methylcytosine-specific restriction enzyme subunit McrC
VLLRPVARLVVREYGDEVSAQLPDRAVEALRAASNAWRRRLRLKRAPLTFTSDGHGWWVRAEGVAGIVHAGGVTVEVMPKFLASLQEDDTRWRRALWNVLALTDPTATVLGEVPAQEEASFTLADLLGYTLVRSIEQGSARGLPRGYSETAESLPVLRGYLDSSRLGELAVKPWLLPCRFDELQQDVPVNRLLRWAAERLQRAVISPRLAMQLGEVSAGFEGVPAVPPALPAAMRISLGPLHAGLSPALSVSLALLRSMNLEHDEGGEALEGFLWEGERVFEDFVLRLAMRAAIRLRLRAEKTAVTMGRPFGAGVRLRTFPDVRVRGASGDVVVLDAKYKLERGRPRAPDVYQVVAAGKTLGTSNAALVYPLEAGDSPEDLYWSLEGPGPPDRLLAVALDMGAMAEPEGERQLTDRMETLIRAARAGNPMQLATLGP